MSELIITNKKLNMRVKELELIISTLHKKNENLMATMKIMSHSFLALERVLDTYCREKDNLIKKINSEGGV